VGYHCILVKGDSVRNGWDLKGLFDWVDHRHGTASIQNRTMANLVAPCASRASCCLESSAHTYYYTGLSPTFSCPHCVAVVVKIFTLQQSIARNVTFVFMNPSEAL
jgi:hypothetical protein